MTSTTGPAGLERHRDAGGAGGPAPYPFAALVGAEDLKLALALNAVHPPIGGVLVRGEKGTAKSTAVRGLAALLPEVALVPGCRFACDPAAPDPACPDGPHPALAGGPPAPGGPVRPGAPRGAGEVRAARLVELPVGASEDRVAGSMDLERALLEGRRAFEPGLLARAHRGVLYVDEVNLLGDHLVDLLLDAAAMGVNHVEREGVSVRHAARFQLVGTMNPEEGELRPQLLDRFGLTVTVRAPRDPAERAEVVRRRLAYEADPAGFGARWAGETARVAARIRAARALVGSVRLGETALAGVVAASTAFEVDGLRADLVTAKAATALAAWEQRTEVTVADVRAAARLTLPHRRRRGPFEQPGIDEDRLDEALAGLDDPGPDGDPGPGGTPGGGPGGPPGGGRASGGPDGAGPGHGPDDGGSGHARDLRHGGGPGPDGTGRGPGGPRGRAGPPRDRDARDPGGGTLDQAGPDQDAGGRPEAGTPRAGRSGGAAVPTVLPVGAPFDPVLLRVPGVGTGAWGRRSPAVAVHGRHVGDRLPAGRVRDLALGATLRAAAPAQRGRGRSGSGLVLRGGDLREKLRQGREGNLLLFVVDASGSMAARQRMRAVKGALLSLLLDAYRRRDRVGLVTFAGDAARLALPPTGSVELAARLLATLPAGGRTPLAAGLARAAEVLAVERVRDPGRRPLLVCLTDGRANGAGGVDAAVAAAAGLAARGVAAVVVDTEQGPVRLGLAGRLAAAMGAPWLQLEELAAGSLAGLARGLADRGVA